MNETDNKLLGLSLIIIGFVVNIIMYRYIEDFAVILNLVIGGSGAYFIQKRNK